MSPYRPAFLGLCAALVLACPLPGSPRRDVSRPASDSREETSTPPATGTPTKGPLPAPVMTRRVITKVDGVIVEDSTSTPIAPPLLPKAQASPSPQTENDQKEVATPRIPEGVIYDDIFINEEAPEISIEEEAVTVDASTEPQTTPDETAEEPIDGGGFFDNFFNPTRTVDSSGMRFGKRRGSFIGPQGSTEPVSTPVKVPEPTEESPFIAPSPNLIVGEVVSVDQAHGIVVAWMQTRFITLDRNVITRNHELETTSVLRPTQFRNGRAYGLDIAVGQPNVGDEVVLADAGPARRRQDDLSVNVSVQVEPSIEN